MPQLMNCIWNLAFSLIDRRQLFLIMIQYSFEELKGAPLIIDTVPGVAEKEDYYRFLMIF